MRERPATRRGASMAEEERPADAPAMTFETFVVGSANRLAAAAARRACESPGTAYNPLFLYSAPGLGKTHILHAIGKLTGFCLASQASAPFASGSTFTPTSVKPMGLYFL